MTNERPVSLNAPVGERQGRQFSIKFRSFSEGHLPKKASALLLESLLTPREREIAEEKHIRRGLTILLPLCCLYAVSQMVYTISASFFPTVAESRGIGSTEIGAIFAAYAAFSLIFSLASPRLAKRLGSKKIMIIGILMESSATLAFGFTDRLTGIPFFLATFFLRGVAGAGMALYMVAALTVLIGEYPKSFSSAMGTFEAVGSIGVMIGPLIGGLLYSAFASPGTNTTDSLTLSSPLSSLRVGRGFLGEQGNGTTTDDGFYALPFIFAATVQTIGACAAMSLIPKKYASPPVYNTSEDGNRERENMVGIIELIRQPQSILISFSLTLCFFVIVYFDPILEPYVQHEFKLNPASTGVLFLLLVGAYALAAPIGGQIADRTPKKIIHVIGLFIGCGGLLLCGPAAFFPPAAMSALQTLAIFAIGVSIFAIGCGFAFVPLSPELLAVGKGLREGGNGDASQAVAALISALFSVGAIAGPLVSSSIVEVAGFSWSTTVASLLLLGTGVLTLILCLTGVVPWDQGRRIVIADSPTKKRESFSPSSQQATERSPLI